jgi:hypothetical protein
MTGRTLPDLCAELERQKNHKRDFLASVGRLKLRSNGTSHLEVGRPVDEPFVLNEIAHGQLAEYTGVPKPFYDRLRKDTEALKVAVWDERLEYSDADTPVFDVLVNSLLWQRSEDTRLVRTLDGAARALLSDKYNPDLDNYDVFQVAAGVLEQSGLGPDNVVSCEVTERKLYLKVVSPKLEAVIRPENLARAHGGHHFLKEPQVVQAGVVISNSEVGLGSLSVQQVVYKLMCTNLWIMEAAYRQRHVGRVLEADEDSGVYRSDTRLADAKARLLKLRDHVAEALDEHRFRAAVGRMQEATGIRPEGKVEQVVELTAKRFGLREGEKEDVLRNFIEGADLSLWGLTNAVTAAAHRADSYDRSVELEAIGGRMLALPASEMKELAWAA